MLLNQETLNAVNNPDPSVLTRDITIYLPDGARKEVHNDGVSARSTLATLADRIDLVNWHLFSFHIIPSEGSRKKKWEERGRGGGGMVLA